MSRSIAAKPVDLPLENGAPLVLLPVDPNMVHLPALSDRCTGRPISLGEYLASGSSPLSWRALCGARGHVFVYALMFAHRRVCPLCEVQARKLAKEAAAA